MRRATVLAALVAGLAVAAAAFADASDPKVKETKADQAHAVAALLQATTLGPAWSGSVETPSSIKIPVCPSNQANNSDLTITGHAEDVVSLASSGLQVDTDVEIFKSAAQVDTLFKRMLQPTLGPCLRYDLLKSVAGTTVTVGAVKRLSLGKVGTHAALYRVALADKTGGKEVPVDNDFLFVAKSRTVFFTSVVAPAALESQLSSFENRIAAILVKGAKV